MSTNAFEKLGRSVVESAYKDLYEEIGRQALHGGGPGTDPTIDVLDKLDERIAREQILPRIDDELIQEHEGQPIGQHSDDLQRVLHYFRRQPPHGKYIIAEVERNEEWCLGVLSGERGEPPELLRDTTFESLEAAQHAVFTRRVEELQSEYGED